MQSLITLTKLSTIVDMSYKFITDNNFTIHNNKNTFYRTKEEISCIDHVYSHCPQKISYVITINNSLSDHAMLSVNYHMKAPFNTTKLIKTRKSYLLTEHTLCAYI